LGLVYDISCGFHQYSGGGLFSIQASISEMHIETFFRELYSTLRGIVIDDNLLNEICRHRTRALSDLKLIPSDPSSVAFRLGWHLLTGADSRLTNWQNLLEGLSAQDIVSNSLKLFCPRNLAVAILGPKDAESETRFQKAIFDF
ncbi:MAG: hypothetical protein NT027_17635, partial [Proteobacteria bacterium]|nr:hypothetical protein [Pseudomonadota bacterium]